MENYLKIKSDLFFVRETFASEKLTVKQIEVGTHHIFVIDCSGSMYGELSQIRKDLYEKISTSLKPIDSVSIIWFSGRGEYGALVEDYHINGPINLESLKSKIDKYLTPQGLTAFKQPLEEVKALIGRVKQKQGMMQSLFFLTDGYDNQSTTKEILKAAVDLKEVLNGATFVEYGWYCNKELMSQMAMEIGGVHTFSKNFVEYKPYLEKQFSSQNLSTKKYVSVSENPAFGIVYQIVDGDIIVMKPNEKNEVYISSEGDVDVFYFTNSKPKGVEVGGEDYVAKQFLSGAVDNLYIQALYAGLFSFSRLSDYNMVSEILKYLGDAYLITEKANTFGTQKIVELEAKFKEAANNSTTRFKFGYNPDLEPKEDAYSVLDLISELMNDENSLWYPQHEAFNYSRIGAKAVSKKFTLKDEDKANITALLEANQLDEVIAKINLLKNSQVEELEFHHNNENEGHPISDLVWNESRANLSVMVTYNGYVNLPANEFGLAEKFSTKIFRNYTIIKDGIINFYELPVSLSKGTFDKLQSEGLLAGETYAEGQVYVLDYSSLPVVNRKMTSTLSAKELFTEEYELLKLKARNTVFNHYKKRLFDKLGKDFIDLYGKEATEWLKSLGVTASGFNPPKELQKSGEEINVNTLEVKIGGRTLPTAKKDFDAIEAKIDKGAPLTPRESLLEPAIKEYKQFVSMLSGVTDNSIIENWLTEKSKNFKTEKNRLMSKISQKKFLTIVGKTWFNEFADRSQNELTLTVDSQDISFVVEDKMEVVKI